MISPTLSIVLIALFSSFILATLIIQYFEQKQEAQSQIPYFPIKKTLTSRKAKKWYKSHPQALDLFNEVFPYFDIYMQTLETLARKEMDIQTEPFDNDQEKEENLNKLKQEWETKEGVKFNKFMADMAQMLYEVYGFEKPNFIKEE